MELVKAAGFHTKAFTMSLSVKESYRAQNSLKLKLPFGPPHHSTQNKEISHLKEKKKKKDVKVDYAQFPAGPASGPFSEFLAPAL